MKRSMIRPIAALCIASSLAVLAAGCSKSAWDTIDASLETFNSGVAKAAPLVGKGLLQIGNLIVSVQCSTYTPVVGGALVNSINIVAPDSDTAEKAADALAVDEALAGQLCPLAEAIVADVGTVPAGTPVAKLPAASP